MLLTFAAHFLKAGMRQIRALTNGRQVEGSLRIRTVVDRRLEAKIGGDSAVQVSLDGLPAELRARIDEYQAAGVGHLVVGDPRCSPVSASYAAWPTTRISSHCSSGRRAGPRRRTETRPRLLAFRTDECGPEDQGAGFLADGGQRPVNVGRLERAPEFFDGQPL